MKRYYSGLEGARVKKKARVTGPAAAPSRPRVFTPSRERKYFDTYLSNTAIVASTDWTGTELDPGTSTLFYPQEGSDLDNRIGRRVEVYKISVRGQITCDAQANQTATDAASDVRLILALDQQTNGAQMQGEDLMEPPGAATANLTALTFQNKANFGRFRVLKDKTFTLQNPNAAWDGVNMEQQGLTKNFKWTVKFQKPIEVRYNGTNGGTVADVVNNSFHLIGQASSTALAPKIHYQCRTVYTDA